MNNAKDIVLLALVGCLAVKVARCEKKLSRERRCCAIEAKNAKCVYTRYKRCK